MEPTGRKGKARAKRSRVKDENTGASGKEDPKDLMDSNQDGMEECPVTDAHGRKRPFAEPLDKEVRYEVQDLLDKFRDHITKIVVAKRRRLEMNSSVVVEVTNHKLEEVWKTQKEQRWDLTNAINQQLLALLQQSDIDLKKAEEREVSFMLILRQQERLLQQRRTLQKQTLRELQSFHKQFMKNVEDMKKDCENFLTEAQSDLRNELALLLTKVPEDSQDQLMAAIQLFLQSLLLP